MSKIKRAFTVEQETKRLRLMQHINRASLSEAEDENLDSFQTGSAASRDLTAIATQVMQPGTGSIRFVLSMTHPDLKKYYLKSGGGADTAEMILAISQDKDNTFTNLAKNIKTNKLGRFVQIEGDEPSMVKTFNAAPKLNSVVLLNVPATIAKEFVLAADENAAKEAFVKMMTHKFYVGTLNRSKMTSSGAVNLDKAVAMGDDTQLVQQFDPHWLEHWRDNTMRVRAIDQWDSLYSDDAKEKKANDTEDAQSARIKKKGENAEQEHAAQASIDKRDGGGKGEAAIRSIISSAKDIAAMKNTFDGEILAKKYTRDEVIATVTKMEQALDSSKLRELLGMLGAAPSTPQPAPSTPQAAPSTP